MTSTESGRTICPATRLRGFEDHLLPEAMSRFGPERHLAQCSNSVAIGEKRTCLGHSTSSGGAKGQPVLTYILYLVCSRCCFLALSYRTLGIATHPF